MVFCTLATHPPYHVKHVIQRFMCNYFFVVDLCYRICRFISKLIENKFSSRSLSKLNFQHGACLSRILKIWKKYSPTSATQVLLPCCRGLCFVEVIICSRVVYVCLGPHCSVSHRSTNPGPQTPHPPTPPPPFKGNYTDYIYFRCPQIADKREE